MTGRFLLALLAVALLVPSGGSCGRSSSSVALTDTPAGAATQSGANGPLALRAPASLADRLPPQSPQAFLYGRYLYGAYALQQGQPQRVSADQQAAVFDPAWQAGAGEPAYAVYGFNMTYFEGTGEFALDWEGGAPGADELYIGLGNFATERWDWLDPAAPLELDDLALYLDEDLYLLLAVVVLGDEPVRLSGIRIGDRVLQEGVDMAMLFAPPLDFETDQLNAELDARTPGADDYTLEEEIIEGIFTYHVVSYTVDGLKIYGVLRFPTAAGEGDCPVLLWGHGGVGVANMYGLNWFTDFVGDSELVDQFFVAIAASRGETVWSGSAGYTCEGVTELYDHDADDALGLLDCALTYYPQADPERVAAAGWSRGAQIVMRAGTRDPRIGKVISLAGWTNEWAVSGQSYAYYKLPELTSEPMDVWNSLYAYDHQLWELRYEFCDSWEMRQLFLRMSVAYNAARMPAIQVHQGEEDPGIDASQGESIAAWLEWEGHTDYEYFLYPGGTHAPNSFTGAPASIRAFLAAYMPE